MTYYDVETRLFRIEDDLSAGATWSVDREKWVKLTPSGIGKGFADGIALSERAAKKLYPEAFKSAATKAASPVSSAEQWVWIKQVDKDKQIVYGEVYAPGQLDTFGEFMSADDIETMAHRFMRLDLRTAIDTQHDNIPNGAYPVESFIARKGDPDYTEDAWVLGVKIPDAALWQRVRSGELNGFSFQSLVRPTEVEVEYEVTRDKVGKTERQKDHAHIYYVELDELGNVTRGITSRADDGHFHKINCASVTEPDGGHNHRFFL